MVYVKRCETYEKETILKCIREIFEQNKVLEGISGLTVAVKPNLVCKKTPEHAATTHPVVVWAVCKLLKDSGANVIIAESPSGFYEAGLLKSLYKITGIEKAALESGAELNFDTSVTEVENPDGKYLKKLKILTPLAKADRIINIAKLKTHSMMVYTGAVKNLFGSIAGLEKTQYHFQLSDYDDFADCIIDIFLANSPVFNIIDAVTAMHKVGPTAGEPYQLNKIFAGNDAFEVDVVATKAVNIDCMRVPVLKRAAERGLVSSEADKIIIAGDVKTGQLVPAADFVVKYNDSLSRLHFSDGILGKIMAYSMRPRPVFNKNKCKACDECVKCCPAKVIHIEIRGKNKYAKVNLDGCIRCYCCQEVCMFKAIDIKKPLLNKIVVRNKSSK